MATHVACIDSRRVEYRYGTEFRYKTMATPIPTPAVPVTVPALDHLEEDDEFEEFEAQGLPARSFYVVETP